MYRTKLKFQGKGHFVYLPSRNLTLATNLRFWAGFFKSIWSKYKLRALFILSVLLAVIFLIKTLVPNLPVFEDNLTVGVIGEYTESNLPQPLSRLYSAGLTKIEKDGQIVADLAQNWTTVDGKRFVFNLKDNLLWQDNKKLTVADLQFLSPNVQVNVVNDQTLEFILADTFSPFPQTLAKPVFRKDSQVGTGPYKIGNLVKNGQTSRQITLIPKDRKLPQVTIRFFPNSTTATMAFKTGQISVLFNLMRLNGLENWKGVDIIQSLDSDRLVAVFYNTKDELLSNAKVRHALDLSIDRSKFKNPTAGPYPPTSWVYLETKSVFDTEKAAKLVAEEKVTGAKIKILTPAIFESLAQDVAYNWKKIGLEVELEKIDKIPDNFQVAIFGLEVPADPDQYIFWHSTQSQTLTKIEDPKLDKLLEDGRKQLTMEERKETYQQLQKELKQLVPASFLFAADRYIVINRNSQNKLDKIRKYLPDFPTD